MAETDPQSPRAWATCERCGFQANLYKLAWQYDWRGAKLDNTRHLVCEYCYDNPQRQLGVVFIPPDPLPKINARPEQYTVDEQPVSTRYTMNGVARAVRYRPYASLRIASGLGNVPATSLPLLASRGFNFAQGGIHINGGVSSSTCSVTLPTVVGIGDFLCISVSFVAPGATDTVSVSDNRGNTYVAGDVAFNASENYVLYTFYTTNITNSPRVITATNTSSARTFMTIIVDEFSIGATVALDGHSAQAQNFPVGLNAVSSGNYTTVRNGDLIWGVVIAIDSFGISAGSQFNYGFANNVISSFTTEYKIQPAAGTTSATGTLAGASNTVAGSLAFSHS